MTYRRSSRTLEHGRTAILLSLPVACALSSCTRNPPASSDVKADPTAAALEASAATSPAPEPGADGVASAETPLAPEPAPTPELEPIDVTHPKPRFLVHVPQRELSGLPEFFSPDGRHVGVDGVDGCDVWEVESGFFAGTIEKDYCGMAWLPVGQTSRLSPDGAWLLDAESGTPFVRIEPAPEAPPSALDAPDEEDEEDEDEKADAKTDAKPQPKRLGGCAGDCGPADAVAWKPTGDMIAIGRKTERVIELWSVAAGTKQTTLKVPKALDIADEWLAWGPDGVVAFGEEPLDGESDEDEDEDQDEDYEDARPHGPQPTTYLWDPEHPAEPDREQHATASLDSALLDPLGRHLYLLVVGDGRVLTSELTVLNVGGGPSSGLELESEDEDPFEDTRESDPVDAPWRGGPDLQHVSVASYTSYDGESHGLELDVLYAGASPVHHHRLSLERPPDELEHFRSAGERHAFRGVRCDEEAMEADEEEDVACETWLAPPEGCDLRSVSAGLTWALATCGDDEVPKIFTLSADARKLEGPRRVPIGKDHGVVELGFGTGPWLWTIDEEDTLQVRDGKSLDRQYRSRGPAAWVPGTMLFDRDVVAIKLSDAVHFVDTTTWKPRLKIPCTKVERVAFHPHDPRAAMLYEAEDKRWIGVLDLDEDKLLKRWSIEQEHDTIAWRDDGSALLTGVITPEGAWDPVTGAALDRLPLALDPLDAIEDLEGYDPTWRFGVVGPTSLLRVSDGVELDVAAEHTRDGYYAGPREKPPFAVFRLGRDVLSAPLVTSASLINLLHHPSLVEDFFAGRPIIDARVFRPLAPPPTLSLAQDPITSAWTVDITQGDVDPGVAVAGRTVTTSIKAGFLPIARWTDQPQAGRVTAQHEFTNPGGATAPFLVESCTADGVCATLKSPAAGKR
ncbi:MAG: hypothetical protein KC468_38545 [Myxococcales bacterium]|nr:hypothetical protein [Myxococcales bacterium]